MKVVILAGGLGTRLAEHTDVIPKPMVEIGGRPMLWHIMKCYAHFGLKEFHVAVGYKGDVVKRYFADYHTMHSDLTVDLGTGNMRADHRGSEDWVVHLTDTGLNSMTGGRLGRLRPFIGDETFMLTYGDGLSTVDMNQLMAFHRERGLQATVSAVRPPARYGGLEFDTNGMVTRFTEKSQIGEGWINGGFMVLEPSVLEYVEGDEAILEQHILDRLATEGQLAAYQHEGFWQSMDTLRDVRTLNDLWNSGSAPWKMWSE